MKIKRVMTLQKNDGFYFPLFNLKGLKSSITPFFGGDLKLDQHHFLLEPTTEVDLFNNIFSRNVIFSVNNQPYFLNGQTAAQQNDEIVYETGLLYQKVTRKNRLFLVDTLSFIPLSHNIELHRIRFTNSGTEILDLQITTAIPIYGRSADNLRDHRHVTSLLHRIETVNRGILVQPTLSFDERGHKENHHVYGVFADSADLSIAGYIPVMDDFIAGGSLHFPKGLGVLYPEGTLNAGYEAMGAISFHPVRVLPGQSVVVYLSLGIHESREEAFCEGRRFLSESEFNEKLNETSRFFETYCQGLEFSLGTPQMSERLNWVVLQPLLRRHFGNSFLPHHDYGRGGRGWRDLWQDLLSLIMMNDPTVEELLFNNFQGIRIDGSNATIIGDRPGEFKADRNMITRVWSDHGAWPLLTVQMYLDETGDLAFLGRKQSYFMDQFIHFTHGTRPRPASERQTDGSGRIYEGSVLEHLLLQNLVGHHNIGEHGFVRLEDADWNDGLDMASERGETVAFTHMYANNLLILANLIRKSPQKKIRLFSELADLLEPDADLEGFFRRVADFSGTTRDLESTSVASKLETLGNDRILFLRNTAFKNGRFQSYFTNHGVDLDDENTLSLTGQAMALLNQTATPSQAVDLAGMTREKLFRPETGGYRLNSDYGRIMTDMGRAFGFAYGHKENGAVFSHMAVMYAYGLYRYGMVPQGHEAAFSLLNRAENPEAKVWAGIPEYFTDRGEGKYSYLTGSASWLLKLLRTEIFGIVFHLGEFHLEPKLRSTDFRGGKASIRTYLFRQLRTVTYHNPKNLDFGSYRIAKIVMGGKECTNCFTHTDGNLEVFLDEIL